LEFKLENALDQLSLVGLIFAPAQEKHARIYFTISKRPSEGKRALKPTLRMRPFRQESPAINAVNKSKAI